MNDQILLIKLIFLKYPHDDAVNNDLNDLPTAHEEILSLNQPT